VYQPANRCLGGLTYLRDRLTVARDLLTDSGSIFVQIGDENVHRVRALMDEVFGEENHVYTLLIQKTCSVTGEFIQSNSDTIIWHTRRKDLTSLCFLIGLGDQKTKFCAYLLSIGTTTALTRSLRMVSVIRRPCHFSSKAEDSIQAKTDTGVSVSKI
jgi:hypothetical protein